MGRGLTLSTRQAAKQRLLCFASGSPTVNAARGRFFGGIATRLIVPELQLPFGERIKAVGDSDELGSWELETAPILAWTEGNNWVHHLQLSPGHHEFKLLIIRDNETTHWEQGPNRSIEVPERIDGIFEVKCQFEITTSTETCTIPYPVKEQDRRAIRQAEIEVEKATTSEHGRVFHNDIIAQGDLPDALEGDTTEREPNRLSDAKRGQQRFSWQRNDRKDDRDRRGDRDRQGSNFNSRDGPEIIVSPHKNSTWSASGQASLVNGSAEHSVDLSRTELSDITKKVFRARGKPVEMYGGAEAKELEDGSVLVKFPADDKGEDILKLVQRLLGDKIPDLDKYL